jgi:hypothetical protein
MPIMRCRKNGKPGYKYGPGGYCYTYTPGDPASRKAAKRKATAQGQAIRKKGGH